MSGTFIREQLPDPEHFFEGEGVPLVGHGKWKTGPCHFHGSRDSLRVNTKNGGWVCMACGAKGGDVLSYLMQYVGLEFVEAARVLGAYVDDGHQHRMQEKPTALSARSAMEVVALELGVAMIVMSDIRRGVIPTENDWHRFVDCVGRIEALVEDFRS